jgi:Flp pilus assembly protein TadD
MAHTTALAEFKQGVTLLRNGYSAEAVEYLQHATELEQQNPYYLSFLGVSIARAQRKWAAAARFCEMALTLKRNEAQLYLNLAEVYLSAGQRDDAIEILENGLRYCQSDARIQRVRGSLGKRGAPVLPFLGRGHFLNWGLGKLRHRTLGRLRNEQT